MHFLGPGAPGLCSLRVLGGDHQFGVWRAGHAAGGQGSREPAGAVSAAPALHSGRVAGAAPWIPVSPQHRGARLLQTLLGTSLLRRREGSPQLLLYKVGLPPHVSRGFLKSSRCRKWVTRT